MYIVASDNKQVVNMANVNEIFASGDEYSVKATFAGGGCQLARYNSPVAAHAIRMIIQAVGRTDVFYMPDEDAVRADIRREMVRTGAPHTERHAANGAVTKRRGGS